MKQPLSLNISGMRDFGGLESSQILADGTRPYFRSELAVSLNRDAQKTAFVLAAGLAYILKILRVGSLPQVRPSIVVSNTVDVVNQSIRPIPGLNQPNDAMRLHSFRPNGYYDIAVRVCTKYLPGGRFSGQNARVRIVRKERFGLLGGQRRIWGAHAVRSFKTMVGEVKGWRVNVSPLRILGHFQR